MSRDCIAFGSEVLTESFDRHDSFLLLISHLDLWAGLGWAGLEANPTCRAYMEDEPGPEVQGFFQLVFGGLGRGGDGGTRFLGQGGDGGTMGFWENWGRCSLVAGMVMLNLNLIPILNKNLVDKAT